MIDRRTALGLLATPLFPQARAQTAGNPVELAASQASLAAVANAVGIAFGAACDREILNDADARSLVARETRVITTENALKFDWLRPRGPEADFSTADMFLEFAERNALRLRGHALIWNDNLPAWLARSQMSSIRKMFDRHIEETMTRYHGRLHSWDVVNEPFYPPHRLEGGYRKGLWYAAFGESYIERALRRAALADPLAKLTLNEAFCEQNDELGQSVRARLLSLVERLKGDGVPLHAVGLQAHLKPGLPFDDHAFSQFLSRLGGHGVEIYITELDVDDSAMPDDIAERDRLVANRYRDFLRSVLAVPQVKLIIVWQLSDRYSWYRELARRQFPPRRAPRPLPFDEALHRKPAAAAIVEALLSRLK